MGMVRLVALISGGIDSPVAASLMASRGAEITLLHMDNRPFGDERGLKKVQAQAELLRSASGQQMPLLIAPHGENQTIIKRNCDNSYQCVLCKTLMLKVAEQVALNTGCHGIVMGDSLGQVASQTLRNLDVVGRSISLPILRPLIGLDKLDIEAIGKKVGTYAISIMPEMPCTAVPNRPITQADSNKMRIQEERIDLPTMVESSVRSALKGFL
jgi:thiamine biosynthesis protein ThiI